MAQTPMYEAIANSPGTEISADISASDTTIAVLDASKLPDAPNLFTIGSDETAETILYTGKSANSLTGCTRGFNGTTAKGWSTGSKVARNFTGYDHDTFIANIGDLDQRVTTAQAKADAAETPSGAQAKANTAEANANAHSDSIVGSLSDLLTTNQTNVVAALNEVFINANNLKSDWAGVIGSPLASTDTSAQLKSKTQTIKDTLATNLTNKNQASTGAETLTALVAKVANINTGYKKANGTVTSSSTTLSFTDSNGTTANMNHITVSGLTFTPTTIVVSMITDIRRVYGSYSDDSISGSAGPIFTISTFGYKVTGNAYINSSGFRLPVGTPSTTYTWHAYE